MTIQVVNTVRLRPERIREFRELVAELAHRAEDCDEAWSWLTYQVMFGQDPRLHFVTHCEHFEEIQKLGTVESLWRRVVGMEKGSEHFLEASECIETSEPAVSLLRPELSYMTETMSYRTHPYASVIGAQARPGHADALEELMRKVAEAIPKVDDPARISSWQRYFGEMATYYSVRPLASFADIDAQRMAPDLLDQAFGPAEGGLIWRAGMDAIQQARRQLLVYVPELSHPPMH